MVQELNKAIVQVLRVLEAPCKSKLAVAAAMRASSSEKLCEFVNSVYPYLQQAFEDRDKEVLECQLKLGLGVDL